MDWNKLNGRFPTEVSRVFLKHGIKRRPDGKSLWLAAATKENFAGDLYDEIHPFSDLDGDQKRKAGFISDLKNAAFATAGLIDLVKGKKSKKTDVGDQKPIEQPAPVIDFKKGIIIGLSVVALLTIILIYLSKRK
jgi:hypothetical protein